MDVDLEMIGSYSCLKARFDWILINIVKTELAVTLPQAQRSDLYCNFQVSLQVGQKLEYSVCLEKNMWEKFGDFG